MALPNPRVLPAELSFWSTSFTIEWAVSAPFRARAGGVAVVETGSAAWRATFMSPPRYKKDDLLLIKAWFNSMRGGTFNFLAHDAARPFPRNYPSGFAGMTRAGGGAFDGTATVTAVTATTIALSTLPANFVFKPADYISLVKSGKYSLHQIMEAVNANGSGVATVTVEPPIVTSVFAPPSLTANLAFPLGLFVPDPRSWQGDPTARRAACTFSAWSRIA
jgi:hypothetical protein